MKVFGFFASISVLSSCYDRDSADIEEEASDIETHADTDSEA